MAYYLLSGVFVLSFAASLGFGLFCFVWIIGLVRLFSVCGCLVCGLFVLIVLVRMISFCFCLSFGLVLIVLGTVVVWYLVVG